MQGAVGGSGRPKRFPISEDSFGTYMYGPPAAAASQGNTSVGGPGLSSPYARQVAMRLRVPRSGSISTIRFKYAYVNAGYGGGTFGAAAVALWSDDGTVNHLPSASLQTAPAPPTLASWAAVNDAAITHTLASPVVVTAGNYYHVVVTNTTTNKNIDFFSVDQLCGWPNQASFNSANPNTDPPSSIRHPSLGDLQFASLFNDNNTGWWQREGYFGRCILGYTDGSYFGCGYTYGAGGGTSDPTLGKGHPISATGGVGQRFSIRGPNNIAVTALWLRNIERVTAGTDPITATLIDNITGTTMTTATSAGTVPLTATPGTPAIYTYYTWFVFTAPQILKSGGCYELRITGTGTTLYYGYTMYKGYASSSSSDQWYPVSSAFNDGHANCNLGSGWTFGWDSGGSLPAILDYEDLPFCFSAGVAGGTVQALVWSDAKRSGGQGTLTTSNTVAVCSGTGLHYFVLGSRFLAPAGKYYWEILVTWTASQGSMCGGIVGNDFKLSADNYVGSGTMDVGWYADGSVYYNSGIVQTWGAVATGHRMCFACDLTANRLWGRVDNGAWFGNGGASPDPFTNTNGYVIPAGVLALLGPNGTTGVSIAAGMLDASHRMTIYSTSASPWAFTAPTGFVAP